jgi:hypothetical protein
MGKCKTHFCAHFSPSTIAQLLPVFLQFLKDEVCACICACVLTDAYMSHSLEPFFFAALAVIVISVS